MKICSKCGENIKDITQLKEVGSLGIALRGKCPNCSAWIWAGDLWKKTKEIDRTNPPKKAAVKNSAKTADSFTPKPAKNPAKGLNFKPGLQPEGESAETSVRTEVLTKTSFRGEVSKPKPAKMSRRRDNSTKPAKSVTRVTDLTKPIIGLENQHLHKLNKAGGVANNG